MAKKIPDFKTYEEEAEFWATADAFESTEQTDLQVELDPSLQRTMRPITIRLLHKQINALKAIAESKDMRYQTMIRTWIAEKIREELGAKETQKRKRATAKIKKVQ